MSAKLEFPLCFGSHLCTYRLNHPEDGEMTEMTLPSRHVQDSKGLRRSKLPVGHGGSPHY